MRHTQASLAILAFFSLAGCTQLAGPAAPAAPADAAPVEAAPVVDKAALAEAAEAETTRLNDWFEVKYQEAVARSPEFSTFLGSRLNYDKWDDVSYEAAEEEMNIRRADLAEMRAEFDPANLTHQGQLSFRLAEYQMEQAERAYKWRHYGYTFDQMNGVQSDIPSLLIARHKINTKSDAEAYISRLNGIDDLLAQHIENARLDASIGIRPPLFTYDYVISDATNILTGFPFQAASEDDPSPLFGDFTSKVSALVDAGTITQEEADDLTNRATEALIRSVYDGYSGLISFLEEDRTHATSDDGAWKFPQGDAYYQDRLKQMTTTDMTATEIHDLGLAEVERIHGEMRAIMAQVGYEGSLQDFFEFTRSDPQFFKPNTPEGKAEYLAEATALIDTMKDALPTVFNRFPQAELDVRAVEAFREKSAGKAFYSRPAPDGSRPGIYYANLYNTFDMPLYQMEALAYHEGIPGHHMQLAISQELTGLPKFRKYGGYTAYTEGWGLYSEYLPKEMGFYQDPYSDFGRLAMELWRAARLVVDTGIHDKQWTREQAIEYLITNTPNPEGDCRKAIERYIVMPGQATAYKIGMLKILELREDARARLGDAFDIREFHDVVLQDGPVPLAILEESVNAWVTSKL